MANASAGVHALAGATGGMLAMTLLYPLDNIRARLQVQEHKRKTEKKPPAAAAATAAAPVAATMDRPKGSPVPAAAAALASPSTAASAAATTATATAAASEQREPEGEYVYRGSWDCFQYVVRHLGWQNLYRGLKSAIVGMGVSSAVYFYWYQWFRSRMLEHRGNAKAIGAVDNMLVACVAGVVNVFLTTPFWVVNTRMTIQRAGPPEFSGLWDAFVKIAAENKFYGFYRGIVPSLILVSNPAIQFVTYEQITRVVLRRTGAKSLTAFQAFVIGAIAKALATVFTYPYQVVKSRLQAERTTMTTGSSGSGSGSGSSGSGQPQQQSSTFLGKVRAMWAHEGWESFFAGLNAKLSQTVLTAALMFVLYEKILRIVQRMIQLGAGSPAGAAVAVAVAAPK